MAVTKKIAAAKATASEPKTEDTPKGASAAPVGNKSGETAPKLFIEQVRDGLREAADKFTVAYGEDKLRELLSEHFGTETVESIKGSQMLDAADEIGRHL